MSYDEKSFLERNLNNASTLFIIPTMVSLKCLNNICRCKFITKGAFITILILSAFYFLKIIRITRITSQIVISYVDETDKEWVNDLHKYIAGRINTTENKFYYTNLSKGVGLCKATCNNKNINADIFYSKGCHTHPVYIIDEDVTPALLLTMTYAESTLPCFLNMAQSSIPNANKGIFTSKHRIPKGFIFGPYTGLVISGVEAQTANLSEYAWVVHRRGEKSEKFYVDAVNEYNSNWLRFVNSARYREEQNLCALVFNESVYYMTVNDVEPNTELLVWYGYSYANSLGISVTSSSKYKVLNNYAPPANETICPTCPMTDENRRESTSTIVVEVEDDRKNQEEIEEITEEAEDISDKNEDNVEDDS